ncbi:hypothetical protein [Escherichia coli]|uniref:hypothetical protein n=1 Tax=Escherichia coli TaxID=562 RepID=UPI003989A688
MAERVAITDYAQVLVSPISPTWVASLAVDSAAAERSISPPCKMFGEIGVLGWR